MKRVLAGHVRRPLMGWLLAASMLAPAVAYAAPAVWRGAITGDWFAAANWRDGLVPAPGDDVAITNPAAVVLLTNSTPALGSLTLSNRATLVFSNWDTTLSASNVFVFTNAVITLPPAFNVGQMSNCVRIVCENLAIGPGGSISADAKGYLGSYMNRNGPGTGNERSGGGHGGWGGAAAVFGFGGPPYGSSSAPVSPGSSGNTDTTGTPGSGGGVVRIQASASVVVNGVISANGGASGNYAGGGAGGSIYITCWTLSGADGLISAGGGSASGSDGGSGAGGRIAVVYDPAAQAVAPVPGIRFAAVGGVRGTGGRGDLGTLWFPDGRLLAETVLHSGEWAVPGFTNWSPGRLLVSNAWIRFPDSAFRLTVSNDAVIAGSGGAMELGGDVILVNTWRRMRYSTREPGPALSVGGDLAVTGGASLYVYGAPTSPAAMDYGACVSVTGAIAIASNSWVYPHSHPTNGGSVLFVAGAFSVQAGGGVDADGRGFASITNYSSGYGPGVASGRSGGGYGGRGGFGYAGAGGKPYGLAEAPAHAGSSGSTDTYGAPGGNGGGLVRVQVSSAVTVNGLLSASGGGGTAFSGGGSGGGVFITCREFRGSNGLIRANGGAQGAGGGGGGRIAIVYDPAAQATNPVPRVRYFAPGGTGSGPDIGDIGSIYFPDTRFLDETITHCGQWVVPGFTNWAPGKLTVSNGWIRFPVDRFNLDVAGAITVLGTNAGLNKLELSNAIVRCGGSVRLTNSALVLYRGPATSGPSFSVAGNLALDAGSRFSVESAMTGGEAAAYGALVSVGGSVTIASNAWIYPYAHPTNGGSVLFSFGQLAIASGGGIDASRKGLQGVYRTRGIGPGGGTGRSGGGYGGRGGNGSGGSGGAVYGSSNAPVEAGSSGSTDTTDTPGAGGGSVRLRVPGTVTLNGTITADGGSGVSYSGGGSGGGIYVVCTRIRGAGGLLSANGGSGAIGSGAGGGGGGGRIAVWRAFDDLTSVSNVVLGGVGGVQNGATGTVVWGWGAFPPAGILIRVQ